MELYALPCDGVMAHPLRRGLPILLQKCTQSNHSLRIQRCPHRGRSQELVIVSYNKIQELNCEGMIL